MAYDPIAYWKARGATSPTRADAIKARAPAYRNQAKLIASVLRDSGIAPRSIFEAGCGWGRIARLMGATFPESRYHGIDLSGDRIAMARAARPDGTYEIGDLMAYLTNRRYDLVLSVEVLMHIPDVERAYRNLRGLVAPGGHLLLCEWVPREWPPRRAASWNIAHPYWRIIAAAGDEVLRSTRTGKQVIYLVRVRYAGKLPLPVTDDASVHH